MMPAWLPLGRSSISAPRMWSRMRYDSDNGTYVYVDSRKALGVTLELLHSDPKQ